jgi:hypothetical protein
MLFGAFFKVGMQAAIEFITSLKRKLKIPS